MTKKINDEIWTVADLKRILNCIDDNMKILIFANGSEYPLLETQTIKTRIGKKKERVLELGCGWSNIEGFEI